MARGYRKDFRSRRYAPEKMRTATSPSASRIYAWSSRTWGRMAYRISIFGAQTHDAALRAHQNNQPRLAHEKKVGVAANRPQLFMPVVVASTERSD